MDTFKLLSRSTNLQKAPPASRKPATRNIPSAGALVQPQAIAGGRSSSPQAEPITDSGVTKRGQKRKRRTINTVPPPDPEIPDFFAGNGFNELATPDAEPQKHDTVSFVTEAGSSTEWKSEDQCKHLLWKHKLKVSSLNSPCIKTMLSRKDKIDEAVRVEKKKSGVQHIYPQPLESFGELRSRFSISRRLAQNLAAQGYSTPTEVQLGTLPLLLGSEKDCGLPASQKKQKSEQPTMIDLLTVAPTGSGKTLAFLIPVIQGLLHVRRKQEDASKGHGGGEHVKAIIIAPTHELADQIVNEAKKLVLGTGIKVTGMRKGMQIAQETGNSTNVTQEGVHSNLVRSDILVSTPLMLLNALESGAATKAVTLPSILYLVLDEADVLLDPLFREQTTRIWESCSNPSLSVSLWSATIGSSIETLAQTIILERRQRLGLSSRHHYIIRVIVGLKDGALPTVAHRLIYTATEQGKLLAMRQILHPSASETSQKSPPLHPPFLVFTQTISRAVALHSELVYDIPLEAGGSERIAVLHSDLAEAVRSKIMTGFRKGEIWILITTDLLSRGVDFKGVNGVVNYDIPNTGASYVHRAGRTGRAGREGGIAITLYTKEDIPYVKNIANVIAASEKAHGKGSGAENQNGNGMQKWLLAALPSVSKKSRQELKKKGVAERRPVKEGAKNDKAARQTRISTKSGFDRRLENNRKGAIKKSRKASGGAEASDGDDKGWEGFQD